MSCHAKARTVRAGAGAVRGRGGRWGGSVLRWAPARRPWRWAVRAGCARARGRQTTAGEAHRATSGRCWGGVVVGGGCGWRFYLVQDNGGACVLNLLHGSRRGRLVLDIVGDVAGRPLILGIVAVVAIGRGDVGADVVAELVCVPHNTQRATGLHNRPPPPARSTRPPSHLQQQVQLYRAPLGQRLGEGAPQIILLLRARESKGAHAWETYHTSRRPWWSLCSRASPRPGRSNGACKARSWVACAWAHGRRGGPRSGATGRAAAAREPKRAESSARAGAVKDRSTTLRGISRARHPSARDARSWPEHTRRRPRPLG